MNSTVFNFGVVLCQSLSHWQKVGLSSVFTRGGGGWNLLSLGHPLAHMFSIMHVFHLLLHTECTFSDCTSFMCGNNTQHIDFRLQEGSCWLSSYINYISLSSKWTAGWRNLLGMCRWRAQWEEMALKVIKMFATMWEFAVHLAYLQDINSVVYLPT